MASNWPRKRIVDIADKVGMGPFGSSIKVETFVSEGVPVVSGQHLRGFRLDESPGFNFITEEHAARLKNSNLFRGDVIFTHAGNIENVAFIPENSKYQRYVASQRQFYMRCNLKHVLPSWIVYYFRTHEGRHQLTANAASVGVPSIAQPVSYLRNLEVPVPPLDEQRAIASILDALDDKIELNRRMNATLDSLAQTIYRQMFGDGAAASSWSMGRLADIASFTKGVSYSSSELVNDSRTALVTLKSISRGGGYREDGLKPFAGGYKPEQRLLPGEVVVAHTDLTQAAEVIGRTARVSREPQFSNLVASLDLTVVRPRTTPYTNEYLYCVLTQRQFVDFAYGYTNGTTVLHLSNKALPEYPIRIPPADLVRRFSSLVQPMFRLSEVLGAQTRTLANLRDALLSKLMSGEVRVKP
jgi:type I restriction enzyme S subunit